MFVALESLVLATGKLTVTMFPGKDGKLKVCVAPDAAKDKEAALATPLTLTATAVELEAGFVDAVSSYQNAHASLAEQIAATTAILEQAKSSQSKKAVDALNGKTALKGPAKQGSAVTATSTASSEDDEDEDDAQTVATGSSPAAAAAPVHTGTDLCDLL